MSKICCRQMQAYSMTCLENPKSWYSCNEFVKGSGRITRLYAKVFGMAKPIKMTIFQT